MKTDVSWMWRGKKYSGKLIPSKEDKNNRYARTENGKIKTLPKKTGKSKTTSGKSPKMKKKLILKKKNNMKKKDEQVTKKTVY
jgi:hypothetical protein